MELHFFVKRQCQREKYREKINKQISKPHKVNLDVKIVIWVEF